MTTVLVSRAALYDRPGLWDVTLDGAQIAAVVPAQARAPDGSTDAAGRLLLPGFVDCHTHACWSDPDGRHRLDEWDMKRAGRPYLDVLAAGGGIMASVRAVRAASRESLAQQLLERARVLLRAGSTTIEVKSGYGLTTADELKMLGAVADAGREFQGTLVPTALLGHAIDPDVPRERFVAATIDYTLPAAAERYPAIAVDAFCENGAWTVEECTRLFEAAAARGLPIRVHADQFTSLGMTPVAVALGARSVDHLEASTPADFQALAGAAATFAVALPGCGFHLDGRFARLGPLLPAAADRMCIATNLNPGSSPVWSMALVIALAVRHCDLTPVQAIAAATANPARLLGLADRGHIAAGTRADLVLTRHRDARALALNAGDQVEMVWAAGRRVAVA